METSMKSLLLAVLFCTFSSYADAKCVVEILDTAGDPLGYVFQGESCADPKARCLRELARINKPDAKCEVTLDIGSKGE